MKMKHLATPKKIELVICHDIPVVVSSCFIVVSFGLSPSSVVGGSLFQLLGVQAVCNQLKNIWKNEEGAKASDSAIGHFLCFC
jgi:hypothetical protein